MCAALYGCLKRGTLAGSGSLSSAVFWGKALSAAQASPTDCLQMLTHVADAVQNPAIPAGEEQCDTFVRALVLRADPALDDALAQYAQTLLEDARAAAPPAALLPPGPNEDEESDEALEAHAWRLRLMALKTIYPARADLRRAIRSEPHAWPLPALDLPTFATQLQQSSTTYGPLFPATYTASNFFAACEVNRLSGQAREEHLRPLASLLSTSILDSQWASFYATGDTAALRAVARTAARSVAALHDKLG